MSQASPPSYPPASSLPGQPSGYGVKPHRGAVVLVLGILGLVVCFICGIIAWIMGNADLREMDAGRMDQSGRGMTQAGRIIGIVGTVLGSVAVLGMLLWFVVVAVALGGAAAAAGRGSP